MGMWVAVACAEASGAGTKRFRFWLAQSTLVWTPDEHGPQALLHILDCQLDGREATQPESVSQTPHEVRSA
jgi:hypothetical protein